MEEQTRVRLLVAADRNYEVYVNGQIACRQRNFFNGDEYVLCQRWADCVTGLLRRGGNELDVVVRTDPWRNKNHRCFRPFVLVELWDQVSSALMLASDGSWKVSVISDWRELIALGGNGTIHFERVHVPTRSHSVLSGFGERHDWRQPRIPDAPLPPLYLWNDPPLENVAYRPRLTGSGSCCFVDRAFFFDVSSVPQGSSAGQGFLWTAEFEHDGHGDVWIAAPLPQVATALP